MPLYNPPSSGSGIPATTVDAKGDLIVGTADDTVARLALGANGKALVADSAAATGNKWAYPQAGSTALAKMIFPLQGQATASAGSVYTANRVYMCRFVIPYDGTIADIYYYVAVQNGNYLMGLYDTGDALASSYTLLASKTSTAVPAANMWRSFWQPAQAVTAGQHINVALVLDGTTANLGVRTAAQAGIYQTPDFLPSGGALMKMFAMRDAGSFTMPSAITEANALDMATSPSPYPILRMA